MKMVSMYDRKLVVDILNNILRSCKTILKRFGPIRHPDDFLDNEVGLEKLDAICMQLIALGESLKNLDKITDYSLLEQYPQFEWKKAKGINKCNRKYIID